MLPIDKCTLESSQLRPPGPGRLRSIVACMHSFGLALICNLDPHHGSRQPALHLLLFLLPSGIARSDLLVSFHHGACLLCTPMPQFAKSRNLPLDPICFLASPLDPLGTH